MKHRGGTINSLFVYLEMCGNMLLDTRSCTTANILQSFVYARTCIQCPSSLFHDRSIRTVYERDLCPYQWAEATVALRPRAQHIGPRQTDASMSTVLGI